MIRTCFSTDERGLGTEQAPAQHGVIEGCGVGRSITREWAVGWDGMDEREREERSFMNWRDRRKRC